jgi:hypothetical protein
MRKIVLFNREGLPIHTTTLEMAADRYPLPTLWPRAIRWGGSTYVAADAQPRPETAFHYIEARTLALTD